MDNMVIIDLGSHTLKAGLPINFPNEGEPRVVTPTAVLVEDNSPSPTSPLALPDSSQNGAAESPPRQNGKLHSRVVRPIERGIITNWDGFEVLLYDMLYNQLGWEPGDEGSVLVAEPIFMSKPERETLTQVMFEHLVVNGLFVVEQPVLALYAVGKLSGCVVDIGHGKIDVSTVVEGQTYPPSCRRLNFGGQDLTAYLGTLLASRGIHVADVNLLEPVKESCMRVADKHSLVESEKEKVVGEAKEYKLADGQAISIEAEGLLLGEALMDPSVVDPDLQSLASVVVNACMCHPDAGFRKGALEAILVCGGGSCVPGVSARLLSDIRELCSPSIAPALLQVPEYMPEATLRQAVWMGAAILSKGVFQQNQHITRADYDELGPLMVHRKCC